MAPTKRIAFLTDDYVRNIPPPADAAQVIVWDAPDPSIPGTASTYVPGLGIRVTSKGVRAFIMDYRTHENVQRRPKIGRFPQWDTDRARRKAIKWRAEIDEGRDPRGERLTKRDAATERRKREASEMTVGQLVQKFVAEYLPTRRPRTSEGYECALRLHVLTKPIAGLRVTEVTAKDTSALHLEITRTGRRTQANRTLSIVSRMFTCAERWELRPRGTNPCRGVDRNKEVGKERYPSDQELAAIKAALDAHSNQQGADAIRLLIYTGCRRGEALTMQWDHLALSAERPVWNRPAHLQKTGKNHSVPLAPQAADLLLSIRKEQIASGTFKPDGYVFPSTISKSGRITFIRKTWGKVLREAGIEPGLRLHDLRHGFASMLISAGYDLPVVGRLMAHASPQTTARYAHLADKVAQQAVDAIGNKYAAAEAPKLRLVDQMPARLGRAR
jgi:integrase